MMHPVRHIAFTNELRFARSRDEVFEAFLETDKWFQISYGQERLQRVVNDRRVGGRSTRTGAAAPASSTGRSAGATRRPATRRPATCSAKGSR